MDVNNTVRWNILLKNSMKPLIVGHRGMGTSVEGGISHYIENSVESFLKSLQVGCDGVEMDLFLTGDNQLAVIHCKNEEGDISANVQDKHGPIEEYVGDLSCLSLKLPESISNYDHLTNKTPTVQTLTEILDNISKQISSDKAFVNIELKGKKKQIGPQVLEVLNKYQLPFLISSFNYEFTEMEGTLKEFTPKTDILIDIIGNKEGIPLGLLVAHYEGMIYLKLDTLLQLSHKYQAKWLILDQNVQIICPETNKPVKISSIAAKKFISKIHSNQLYIAIYMSDHEDDHETIMDCCTNGMDMLIVNEVVKAIEIRQAVYDSKTNIYF
ncbi:hypothetical protein BMR1_03g01090 [Babesia microti strain RI]|uniref:GP-PDE domain-containing protein n=1 Tax=Babesia microti (strain RI) TaxID=1133968 RepID=A0A0K3AMN6_BABMR|nr:hypothetical protein BMR1_03g01090 [Babesia microti strain RI]CTQ40817.1 hypothetical protein BMR1_03g01090 [Babesia microti strain RI]|eukprot:XP_012648828.1 hypothetical protein BMR1_03g01090 [Babesia microti strain RI]